MSAKRISIRAHNVQFLESLASQMGITDLSEALNYLLLDVKGLNYQFGNKSAPQTQPTQTRIGYDFDPNTFEPAFPEHDRNERNYQETDPIIARLSTLIEDF